MKPLRTFKVHPSLPEALRPLLHIAYNLRWSWDHAAIELFRRLDHELWEKCGHNPVLLLGSVDQGILEAAAADDSFLAHMHGVAETLDLYLSGQGAWYKREHPADSRLLVAYFSAEFGITECLSIFAGGLGVLAGDHLKAASDLALPLVGVGLLYQQGYFRQYLNGAGWQQEAYEDNNFHTLPINPVPEVRVQVELPHSTVAAQVWSVNVGRLRLLLLDTNLPENTPEDRKITYQLYGGDLEMRLKQEIVLGIGGYRALEAAKLEPTVFHMNEGHSAFLGLERVLRLMETRGLSFKEARTLASASLIFTTHTPVAAGHDYFPGGLMNHYFERYLQRLGITRAEFLGLGRSRQGNDAEDFCMTVLALRLASFSNGVSRLHGTVSRQMWNHIWQGVPEAEVPIGHVTNGVHFRSWVSFEMNQLYDRYLGPKWREEPADPKLWERTESIPAGELWRTHERRRERLVSYARQKLRVQLVSRGASQAAIDDADEVLSPDALTIGFGRRFAAYKRANLLLRDPARLARLLNDPERPMQLIFAGKAHPHDDLGKQIIQSIIEFGNRPELRRKMVFLENYDMATARSMLQGCDVWLNTPRRPLEASGTSGMKAQANGVLSLSTLDGWWDEAWELGRRTKAEVGWAIGSGETYSDHGQQDQVESEALYELLEREIVPTFYERRADGLPRKWIARMKSSIVKLCPAFNMHRMVREYTSEYYLVAHERYEELSSKQADGAKQLASRLDRVSEAWPRLRIESMENAATEVPLGKPVKVATEVFLDVLSPEDVAVEIVAGRVNADGDITDLFTTPMEAGPQNGLGNYRFESEIQPGLHSGLYGYAIRVLPKHRDLVNPFLPGLILWACGASSARPASGAQEAYSAGAS